MKQIINTSKTTPTIQLEDFNHEFQFIGLKHNKSGVRYLLIPKDNNKFTFAHCNGYQHFSEFQSVTEAIEHMLTTYKTEYNIYIFSDGIEMAKWMSE